MGTLVRDGLMGKNLVVFKDFCHCDIFFSVIGTAEVKLLSPEKHDVN